MRRARGLRWPCVEWRTDVAFRRNTANKEVVRRWQTSPPLRSQPRRALASCQNTGNERTRLARTHARRRDAPLERDRSTRKWHTISICWYFPVSYNFYVRRCRFTICSSIKNVWNRWTILNSKSVNLATLNRRISAVLFLRVLWWCLCVNISQKPHPELYRIIFARCDRGSIFLL